MKTLWIAAAIAALSLSPLAASADDKPPAEKKSPIEVTKTITVVAKADGAKGDKKGPVEVKVGAVAVGQAITIGPDGKVEVKDLGEKPPKEVLDKLPKEIRERIEQSPEKGRGGGGAVVGKMRIVVEKDGKRQEFDADLSGPEALPGPPLVLDIGEMLKKQGIQLPPDAQRALDTAAKAKGRGPQPDKALAEVNAKLDKILERLDRLEKEVKANKGK